MDDKATANPYELYILFDQLQRLWERDSEWPESIIVTCSFQAMELCLRLLGDESLHTQSPQLRDGRISRIVDHICSQFRTTAELLKSAPPPASDALSSVRSQKSPGLRVLQQNNIEAAEISKLADNYLFAFRSLPFRLGLEEQITSMMSSGSSTSTERDGCLVLDYERLVRPVDVATVREARPRELEDHFFYTIHQIVECWLHLTHYYMTSVAQVADGQDWLDSAKLMENASRCLAMATETSQLLDTMPAARFHPLRVRLRDASGAQSRAVQQLPSLARKAAMPLFAYCQANSISILEIIDEPDKNVAHYRYLNELRTFSKRFQSFLFGHYLLTLGVMGQKNFGSLGYTIRSMVDRAATPLFDEIDQAHHDYLIITNFLHGKETGSIVMDKEVGAGQNPYELARPAGAPEPSVMRQSVAEYFRYIHTREGQDWVSLFAPTGYFCDAPGSKPYLGHQKLRIFIEAIYDAFSSIDTCWTEVAIEHNVIRARWRFDAVSYNGVRVDFGGIEEFAFLPDGKILTATAYWEPQEVAEQLWPTRVSAG